VRQSENGPTGPPGKSSASENSPVRLRENSAIPSLRASVSERGNPFLQLTNMDCRATAAPSLAIDGISHSLPSPSVSPGTAFLGGAAGEAGYQFAARG
jgi:hypothetical protein